eukprot:3248869-Rhodomonas_salina.1
MVDEIGKTETSLKRERERKKEREREREREMGSEEARGSGQGCTEDRLLRHAVEHRTVFVVLPRHLSGLRSLARDSSD